MHRLAHQALLGVALALTALLPPAQAKSPAPLVGNPPIDRHEPGVEVYPQNFAVARDDRGIVYLGNHDGLLQFDGERWRLLRLPNRELVRSLATVGNRVYIGGYDSFGYAEEDGNGQLVYTELSTQAAVAESARGFADIWDVVATPECIYFRALRDVFCWRPDTGAMRHWHHDGRFGFIAHHAGRTLLQFRGEGLRARDGDGWRKLPGTAAMTGLVQDVAELPDGDLLGLSSDGRWWRIGGFGGDVFARVMRMPDGLPSPDRIHRAISLPDGAIAMAGDDGHVVILARDLNSMQRFRVDVGFVSGLVVAPDGFLVSTDTGLLRVSWPARWRALDRGEGATGNLYAATQWRDERYLVSSTGVLRGRLVADGTLQFAATPWSRGLSYAMLPVDAKRALVAQSHRLLLVEGGAARFVGPDLLYPRVLQPSALMPGQLLIGTEHGLFRGRLDAQGLTLSAVRGASEKSFRSVRVTSLVETVPGEVWFGTQRGGLWRVRGDPADVTAGWHEARRFGADDGLATGPIAAVEVSRDASGAIIASTAEGFFRLEGERFVPMPREGLAALRPANETFRLERAPNGDEWAYSPHHIAHRPRGGSWRMEDVRGLKRGAIQGHYFDAAGRANFVTDSALLVHAGSETTPSDRDAAVVQLRTVRKLDPDGATTPLPVRTAQDIALPQGDYSIAFEFALPEIGRPGARAYQGYLEGLEKQFYGWAPNASYTYTGLRAGTYTLHIRARDAHGRISEMAPYTFTVTPPWYGHMGTRLMAALLIALATIWGGLLLAQRRTVRLERERARLEALVTERTAELAEANRRLEQIAHLDGLTGIPNRRRLDDLLVAVWQRCLDGARPMSVLVVDVDHFKDYNDRHGHLAGDEVLRALAGVMARSLRRTEDVVARYGGEEFLVVLPGADAAMAAALGETLRAAVEASTLGVTVSVGVASTVPAHGAGVLELVAAADKALYAAKHAGRNRVVIDKAAEAREDASKDV